MTKFNSEGGYIPQWMRDGSTIDLPLGQSTPENAQLPSPSNSQYALQRIPQFANYIVSSDYHCAQALQRSQEEMIRLKNQLKRKILKEEELKQVLQIQGMAYFSIMASGRLVQLTHFSFDWVGLIVYDSFYGRKPKIEVQVSTQEKPALIDLEDFWNDKKWISFLERVSQTSIKIYGSVKRVALLLRSV